MAYHVECLVKHTTPRQTDAVTREGMVNIATDCPSCRGELFGSKRRLFCRGPVGDEPPCRTESVKQRRERVGFIVD